MTVQSAPFAKQVEPFPGSSALFQDVERDLSCNNTLSIEGTESFPIQNRQEDE